MFEILRNLPYILIITSLLFVVAVTLNCFVIMFILITSLLFVVAVSNSLLFYLIEFINNYFCFICSSCNIQIFCPNVFINNYFLFYL